MAAFQELGFARQAVTAGAVLGVYAGDGFYLFVGEAHDAKVRFGEAAYVRFEGGVFVAGDVFLGEGFRTGFEVRHGTVGG